MSLYFLYIMYNYLRNLGFCKMSVNLAETQRRPTHWENEPVQVQWLRQFEYFAGLIDRLRNVPGDFVECGVGEGGTFAMLAYLIGSRGWENERMLWGFESFEGWPEPSEFDKSPREPKKGEWQIDEHVWRDRFEKSGIFAEFPNLQVQVAKGFLGQTLPKFPQDRKIAFLHLDVDLYQGYWDGLRYLFPRVSLGGIVAFDEYNEWPNREAYRFGEIEKWPGCTKAIGDYLNGRPEKPQAVRLGSRTKYYLVKQTE